jgi:hypothetical protein
VFNDFDGDEFLELRIVAGGAVDRAHAAAGDHTDQTVAADLPARLDENSIHGLPGFDFHRGRIPEGGAEGLTVAL